MTKPVSGPPTSGPRSSRADARRNYDRLIAAAHDAFSERGADASLEDIARRAGLGSATLHRHFPSRYALMEAVYWNQIDALCGEGQDLLASPDPGDAFAHWLRRLIAVAAERGLATALLTSRRDKAARLFDACHDAIRASGAPLLARGQQAGVIRTDIDLEDVLRIANAIALTIEHEPDGPERGDRLLNLLVEGIRAR